MDSLAILLALIALIAVAERHFVKKPFITGALTGFVSRGYFHYFGTAFALSVGSFAVAYAVALINQLSWAAVTRDLYVSANFIFFIGLAWAIFGGASDFTVLAGVRQVENFGVVKVARSPGSGLPLWLSLIFFSAMFIAVEYGIFLMG